MRQFMLQNARQFCVHGFQSMHWHADAPIVNRPRPRRRLGDVAEGVLGVENHTDRFRRRKVQFGFNCRIMLLKCSQHVLCQRRRSRAAVAQLEVAALVFLVTFFFLLIG